MTTYNLELGGPGDTDRIAENLSLPILPHLPTPSKCRLALDLCVTNRFGIPLVGPKGSGKTFGMKHARLWLKEIEQGRRDQNEATRMRRTLLFGSIRCETPREMLRLLAKQIDKRWSERADGQKKSVSDMRADVVALCRKKNIVALIFDEVETLSAEVLECIRDLLRDSREGADDGQDAGACTSGFGVLLMGDDTFQPDVHLGREAGHRFATRIETQSPEIGHIVEILAVWFPGFSTHIEKVGDVAWENYLLSTLGHGRDLDLRYLETVARLYGTLMVRSNSSIRSKAEIPFRRDLFQLAVEEACWAGGASTGGRGPARPRRGRGGRGTRPEGT